jgi:DNA-directed RNA polymerase specialized sigma subunit
MRKGRWYSPVDRDAGEALHCLSFHRELMTERQRKIYCLYYEDKKTLRQIGGILGISFQVVWKHIGRIKKKANKFFFPTAEKNQAFRFLK